MAGQSEYMKRILSSLSEKGPLKADVFSHTENAFNIFRAVLKNLESELNSVMGSKDKRVIVKLHERGPYDLEFRISDDILMFTMHTDIFALPESHAARKHSYLSQHPLNAFCGLVSIYNFLTDSLKFQRMNDVGVLMGRIFINREGHFFTEGKKQLGFLFSDFEKNRVDEVSLRSVVEVAIIQALESEIQTPPFDQMKVISVHEVMEKSLANVVSTGKRLGFKLQSDTDLIQ
jgi:hypothetical protein